MAEPERIDPPESPLTTNDERREILRILGRFAPPSVRQGLMAATCAVAAVVVAYAPGHAGLSLAGRHALMILVFAAGLWLTEAIPAFAVALVVIALEIVLLGDMGRRGQGGWERFVAPWASPIIWLFLGGFVLGKAAAKTGLDRRLAASVLTVSGTSPARALLGLMVVAFGLSMFMSNTAATVMLLAVAGPIVADLPRADPTRRALVLGIAVAANLGGMATLIGTPPNAIAAGALGPAAPNFAAWMVFGAPPAVLLLGVAWLFLRVRYPSPSGERLDLSKLRSVATETPALKPWRRWVVLITLAVTVGAWFTSGLHHVPTPVVSFFPITVLAATGVLRAADIRDLGWDVLLLVAGGLALGLAVAETGFAAWTVGKLPVAAYGPTTLALAMAFATTLLSTFMSNTAAANILVPVAMALSPHAPLVPTLAVALASSTAMCLPISTPPNAVAYASRELVTRDFVVTGLFLGVLGPLAAVLWCTAIGP